MPHIIVKLYPGRSETQKTQLARQIVQDVVATLGSNENSISVAIEEVSPSDWAEAVYAPEIAPNLDTLYKKPGYTL
jgi:4-oxalocrotonate tautomerase